MRRMILATAVALTAIGALPTASAQPNTFTVDCNRGQTIANALRLGDVRRPLLVKIRGTCQENVTILRDNVGLVGDPAWGSAVIGPDANTHTITVEADRVVITGLTVSGGLAGIGILQATHVEVSDTVVQGTGREGIRIAAGDGKFIRCIVQGTGGDGMHLLRGGSARITDSQIRDNPGSGINADEHSTVVVGGTVISHNGSNGVRLDNGSEGNIANSIIEGSGTNPGMSGAGILVSTSQAKVSGNSVIRNSRADGVAAIAGGNVTVADSTVTANGQHGVNAYLGSLLLIASDTITNNRYSGVVGYAHSTVQISGSTIDNNRGGAGISMMLGSKLLFAPATTTAHGNLGALYCGDVESSVGELSLLDTGGDVVNCTGY